MAMNVQILPTGLNDIIVRFPSGKIREDDMTGNAIEKGMSSIKGATATFRKNESYMDLIFSVSGDRKLIAKELSKSLKKLHFLSDIDKSLQ